MISYERELDIENKLNSYLKITGILNNVDIGKIRRTQQKLFIICYSRQLVSTQLWGHHQAMNKNWRNEMYMEITCALRDAVRFTLVVVHTDGII
jgi:hypothetical protein